MRRTRRTERVTILLAEPLRHELEVEAEENGQTLAGHVRKILVDVAARALVEREQAAA
jgi:hypothetical protein